LVLLQKTMVQVEGVARQLDPKHDMWAASRPIVERWVKRELGADGIRRRVMDEAGVGLGALRRLPQTLAALEGAAQSIKAGPPPAERAGFRWMSFFVGFAVGALLATIAWYAGL
jgi:ubiquinone biosynthesis protein